MANRYVKSLVRRLTGQPDSKKSLFELAAVLRADELIKQKDEDGALNLLNEASKVVPKSALLAYNLGVALATKGKYNDAIKSYREAIQRSSKFSEAHNNLGAAIAALAAQGKKPYRDAINAYNKAVGLNPNFAEAYNNLGAALDASGESAKAIEAYTKAIELNRQFPEAYYNRGVAYAKKGDYERAIADYRSALDIRADYFSALYNLGIALFKTDRTDLAIESYKKAREIEQHPAVSRNLAIAYQKKGEFADALSVLEESLQLNPDDPKAHLILGEVYQDRGDALAENGDVEDAIESYEQALSETRSGKGVVETTAREVEILTALAKAFLKIDDIERAVKALREAATLDPHNPGIRENLDSLFKSKNQTDGSLAELSE